MIEELQKHLATAKSNAKPEDVVIYTVHDLRAAENARDRLRQQSKRILSETWESSKRCIVECNKISKKLINPMIWTNVDKLSAEYDRLQAENERHQSYLDNEAVRIDKELELLDQRIDAVKASLKSRSLL